MQFESKNLSLPDRLEHVLRFDATGNVSALGSMSRDFLSDLMDLWFESAFIVTSELDDKGTVVLPSYYLSNGKPLPDRLANSLSKFMIIAMDWDTSDDDPEFE